MSGGNDGARSTFSLLTLTSGIISELEHFVDAGVDAIWMSPIFASPMIDFGYDISNFYEIHYEYGTMEDFDELMTQAHQLGE